ncbi:K(+) efflux antiporter 2, chloroplastic-like [Heracleum sosnowskyi]|uniref:K(+) efflux antiporter 2, chloroplastic-like n=1 Tax=Heracleum sosnowskyi TaxID=360622 RepID=A0AAD8I1I8_9APIA|nr:K(+) efflux antiporter 2, chloroplastic-like [Heracleum sosnowskyi]
MDSACSFLQPRVIRGGEGTSYSFLERLNWRSGFNCKVFGNERLKWKGRSTNLKKLAYCSKSEFDSFLGCYNMRKSLGLSFGYCIETSRGVVRPCCQGNDSVAYIDGNGIGRRVEYGKNTDEESITEGVDESSEGIGIVEEVGKSEEVEVPSLDDLREVLQKACKELEIARLNSTMFEEKAQRISEAAIALKDEAAVAWDDVNSALNAIQEIVNKEASTKEVVQAATMSLSLAEARLQVAGESLEIMKKRTSCKEKITESDSENEIVGDKLNMLKEEEETFLSAQEDIKECRAALANCEMELMQLQSKKQELQQEVDRLTDVAEKAESDALKSEEDVANIMLLAEKAVAFELEAAKHVNDAEIVLQKAERTLSISPPSYSESTTLQNESSQVSEGALVEEDKTSHENSGDSIVDRDKKVQQVTAASGGEVLSDSQFDIQGQRLEDSRESEDSDLENGKVGLSQKEMEEETEKLKNAIQNKKSESQKDLNRDSSPFNAPKSLLNKSSRFFPASFFSFAGDGTEFTPASFFHGLVKSGRKQLPKLVVGLLLAGSAVAFYATRNERVNQILQQTEITSTSIDEVSSNTKPLFRQLRKLPKKIKKLMDKLPHQEINEEEASLFDVLWLLLASVIFVPLFQKIPGGSPVLGYLTAGILIGPYGFSIIRNVHGTKAIAEFGVVFLMFNIGLELSVERLSSMKKYVFGLGSAQVLVTAVVVGMITHFVAGQAGPAALVIGNGLALSSTAVVLQVLQERGESTSRHGRATFSVLLFQDLAVVVLLILIPLISPNSSKGGVGFQAIAEALGLAGLKAVVAISAIIAGGRLLLRPIYKQIAENQNAEIFSANTLLVILGTSLLTARAGLSMALGAFLAGLLLAETEFSLQVESDIAPYRGLLLGLFFMTVGMSIDPKLLLSNFPVIMGTLGLLIGGKTILVALIGKVFGVSIISALRVGLLLAPGGEFAFVAFGEAVNQGIMSSQLSSLLFLVVGISMALTPWLAAGGQLIASRFEQHDVRSLLPVESETDDLQDHIILCGFGRVGQIIAQLLSERLIPFVALDVRSDRVSVGRALDLPVYFGDAGSREVLHKVGAERACAAAITLDTPGANYRTVWALNKYFPNVKTFVRAHDVDHGINLEKAGATAVVPETLEPSLQLAAAVLAQAKLPMSEITATINEFRSRHLSELTELCEASGSSLGYGYSRVMSKPKSPPVDLSDEDEVTEGTLAI